MLVTVCPAVIVDPSLTSLMQGLLQRSCPSGAVKAVVIGDRHEVSSLKLLSKTTMHFA